MRLPVLAGPLRGQWWRAESGGKLLRVLLGSYEREQSALFRHHVTGPHTVLDVGAHAGFYTLLAARLVGEGGSVWAFEPEPRNADALRRNVALNRCRNVRVEEVAVTAVTGQGHFRPGKGTGTGRLDPAGPLSVRTVALDDFCRDHGLVPTVMKIDVEGGEGAVLRGAAELLERDGPVVFLSTHGAAAHADAVAFLGARGYVVRPILHPRPAAVSEFFCLRTA